MIGPGYSHRVTRAQLDLLASREQIGIGKQYVITDEGIGAMGTSPTAYVEFGGAGPAPSSQAFPVGSVFTSVVATNPATLLGYGTWAAFGAGKVLIGIDSGDTDFDTVKETGGAKTKTISAHSGAAVADHAAHTHTYTQVPNHPFTINSGTTDGTWASFDSSTTAGTARNYNTANPTDGVATATTNNPSATLTHSVTQPSAHTDLNVVQPYIVVYFWERTA
jgi:hypothetical protein